MKKLLLPKKIVAGILIGTIVLSAGGCSADSSGKSSDDRESRRRSSEEDSSDDKNKNEDESKDENKDNEEELTGNGILHPDVTYYDKTGYITGENYTNVFEGSTFTVSLPADEANKYPELQKNLEAYFRQQKESDELQYNEIFSWLEQDINDGMSYFPYTCKSELRMIRSDEEVLSLNRVVESYSGGAHGFYYTDPVNFDVKSGNQIELTDIFKDTSALPGMIMTKLMEDVEDASEMLWDDAEEIIKKLIDGNTDYGEINFLVDKKGVKFYFEPYLLAPYASGELMVEIPYNSADSDNIFKKDYSVLSNQGFIEFGEYETVKTDLGENGTMDTVSVYLKPESSYDYDDEFYEAVVITVNGREFVIDESIVSYERDFYLVHTNDNRDYLYIYTTGMDDYRIIYVYSLTDHSVQFVGSTQGGLTSPNANAFYSWSEKITENNIRLYENSSTYQVLTDPEEFCLAIKIDLLSTYSGYAAYRVGDDGMPEMTSDSYGIVYYGEPYRLTAKKDINCISLDEKGNVVKEDACIPAQTEVMIVGTDAETYVDVKDSISGTIYRLNVQSGWPQTINGVDIEELFDGIMFAG